MNIISEALKQPFNYLIILFWAIVFGGFIDITLKVRKLNDAINDKAKKTGGRREYAGGGMKRNPTPEDWEDALDFLVEFNKIKNLYSMWGQLVPIFPLLGLLGTVIGLVKQLNVDLGSLGQLDAMSLSMTTTFCGLVASIILKFYDAFFVGKAVNSRQLEFDTFESNYHMVLDKKTAGDSKE